MNRISSRARVLITGGGRGLGRAIGRELARNGHYVGLLARTESQLAETVGIIEDEVGTARAFQADVLDTQALTEATRGFAKWAGGLDGLICSAGCFRAIGPIGLVDGDDWWGDIETGLRGAFHAVRAALPFLQASPNPSIQILIGPGFNGELANGSAYGATQAGLVRLVETLAKEFGPPLPIYAVNPGLVPTSLTNHLLESDAGRKWLPRFTEAFGEGKETDSDAVAIMSTWLVENRPPELSGRVIAALGTPTILETRLSRIVAEDLGRLRLK